MDGAVKLVIGISDAQKTSLDSEATRLGISVEDIIASLVARHVDQAGTQHFDQSDSLGDDCK